MRREYEKTYKQDSLCVYKNIPDDEGRRENEEDEIKKKRGEITDSVDRKNLGVCFFCFAPRKS